MSESTKQNAGRRKSFITAPARSGTTSLRGGCSGLMKSTEHEVEVKQQLVYCSAGASFYTMAPNEEGATKGL